MARNPLLLSSFPSLNFSCLLPPSVRVEPGDGIKLKVLTFFASIFLQRHLNATRFFFQPPFFLIFFCYFFFLNSFEELGQKQFKPLSLGLGFTFEFSETACFSAVPALDRRGAARRGAQSAISRADISYFRARKHIIRHQSKGRIVDFFLVQLAATYYFGCYCYRISSQWSLSPSLSFVPSFFLCAVSQCITKL